MNSDDVSQFLQSRPMWKLEDQRAAMTREYVFTDFMQAFSFMTHIAMFAEKKDHHPEWFNVYNKVVMTLTTHDANGITGKDIELAQYADQVFSKIVFPVSCNNG